MWWGLVVQGTWTAERYVLAAGMYGPSGQLIFENGDTLYVVCEAALLRSSSKQAPQLHVAERGKINAMYIKD